MLFVYKTHVNVFVLANPVEHYMYIPGVLINVYSGAGPDEAFHLNLNCLSNSKYTVLG